MDFKDLWGKICYDVNEHRGLEEAKLQISLEGILDNLLGWERRKGELTRPTIPMASSLSCKPDAMLCKEGKEFLCVELKTFINGQKERNEQQLISYMRQRQLWFGLLWANNLKVFYDDRNDDNEPEPICEINFDEDNSLGVELITNLYKENFTFENFQNFCLKQIEAKRKEDETKKAVDFLCSDKGIEYIKTLIQIEYPEEVVKHLKINVTNDLFNNVSIHNFNKTLKNYVSVAHFDNAPNYVGEISDDLKRRENETTQQYIRRVLYNLFRENKISDSELEKLHNKNYCQQTFGINYPLLFDTREASFLGNGYRSWSDTISNYYVCSQWNDKRCRQIYEDNIVEWINRLNRNVEGN